MIPSAEVPLGVPKGQTFLVSHDARWAQVFESERQRLLLALGPEVMRVEHIGSTAIPGIRAKPIVDILVAARHHTLADGWQGMMAALGYDYPGDIGIPDHRIYGRDREIRRFLVHVVDADGKQWTSLLGFRDALLRDRRLAAEYEAIKVTAASENSRGLRSAYTERKTDFIARVLESSE